MQNKKNSPLKTQKNFLKSQYLVDNCLSFQSIIFIADLDELENFGRFGVNIENQSDPPKEVRGQS